MRSARESLRCAQSAPAADESQFAKMGLCCAAGEIASTPSSVYDLSTATMCLKMSCFMLSSRLQSSPKQLASDTHSALQLGHLRR